MKFVRFGSRYVDLHAPFECARASPAALQMFFDLMKQWDVPDEAARVLMGHATAARFRQMRADPAAQVLDTASLRRISFMLAIWGELSLVYGPGIACEWIRLPNSHAMFCQITPLNFMLLGGTQAMKNIHKLLCSRRQAAAQVPDSTDRPSG
jgi:hypothetical protein